MEPAPSGRRVRRCGAYARGAAGRGRRAAGDGHARPRGKPNSFGGLPPVQERWTGLVRLRYPAPLLAAAFRRGRASAQTCAHFIQSCKPERLQLARAVSLLAADVGAMSRVRTGSPCRPARRGCSCSSCLRCRTGPHSALPPLPMPRLRANPAVAPPPRLAPFAAGGLSTAGAAGRCWCLRRRQDWLPRDSPMMAAAWG